MRSAALGGRIGDEISKLEATGPYICIHVRRGDVNFSNSATNSGVSRFADASWYGEVVTGLRGSPSVADWPIIVVSQDNDPDLVAALSTMSVEFVTGRARDDDFALLAGARIVVAAPSS